MKKTKIADTEYSTFFSATMLLSLAYLSEELVGSNPQANFVVAIKETDRVALIAAEWYRQVYV